MLPQELIRKKQQGLSLSTEELQSFFQGFLQGEVADYQVSALLMAIFLNGMDDQETVALTHLVRDSGQVLSWPEIEPQLLVDKHSTGGVGDKVSLVLLPLCLLEGLKVPMIAGRGLGHTGGTLDKLEGIPGMRVFLSLAEARAQMKELGGFIMGQTQEITPLDRRLYALRDVTSTVASIPLIVASILAKKLAEGITALVMDVKFGKGAFMQDKQEALALAEKLVAVGHAGGVKVRAVLTSMNAPLGAYAGNRLEIYECLELLQNQGPDDTKHLSLSLAAHMVQLAFPARSWQEVYQSLEGHLRSGRAFECFCRFVKSQGGETKKLENKEFFRKAAIIQDACNQNQSGYIKEVDVRKLGLAVVVLGGGRSRTDGKIDHQVGLAHLRKVGDFVEKGEPFAVIYGNDAEKVREAKGIVEEAYELGLEKTGDELIWKTVDRI